MFDKNKIHLVPQILQDRAAVMLAESSASSTMAQENSAQQLEATRDYCIDVLDRYNKRVGYKRKIA